MKRALWATAVLALATALPAVAGWEEGVAAFRSRDYQAAYQQFQAYVSKNPNAYQGHYMLGEAALRINRNDEALNHLRKAYDLNPNDLATKLSLGRAYSSVRRYKEAATLLGGIDSTALPAQQKVVFYQLRARARDKAGDSNGALKDYGTLTRLLPNDATIHYRYGVGLLGQDQLDKGLASLKTATRLDPKNEDMKTAYVKALLNKARGSRDRTAKKRYYQQAAAEAKALTALDGSFDNEMLQLSAELGGGLYESAIATGEKAVARNGNDWKANFYLGQALTSAQKFEAAEAPLNKAKGLARSQADQNRINKQLGYAYSKQKKYTEAIAAYEAGGDAAAAARVRENKDTAQFNANVEEENARIEAMRKEAERLEKELQELEGGGGG